MATANEINPLIFQQLKEKGFDRPWRVIDLTGRKFKALTVIGISHKKGKQTIYDCQCDCNNLVKAPRNSLTKGAKLSCGCKPNIANYRHGLCRTRIYRIWRCMINRCEYKGHDKYYLYGGEGIKVCPEWHSFEGFYEDNKEGYAENLSLDRIDNKGHYEKGNTKWATQTEQSNNTRTNVHLTFNGETYTVAQWARKLGLHRNRLDRKIKKNWSFEKLLEISPNKDTWQRVLAN